METEEKLLDLFEAFELDDEEAMRDAVESLHFILM
jgi:hypothetical protein